MTLVTTREERDVLLAEPHVGVISIPEPDRGPLTVLRAILLASAVVALAPPDGAATILTLSLDPALSSLTPEGGAPQSLSGTIIVSIDSLPVGGASTKFDVIGLALTASGGAALGLDPALAAPGLGISNAAGSFLVPTLFVRITDGETTDLAIPDVAGGVVFAVGGTAIEVLTTAFEIDTPSGIVSLSLLAVPEPATAVLLAAGLVVLRSRRSHQEISR